MTNDERLVLVRDYKKLHEMAREFGKWAQEHDLNGAEMAVVFAFANLAKGSL